MSSFHEHQTRCDSIDRSVIYKILSVFLIKTGQTHQNGNESIQFSIEEVIY